MRTTDVVRERALALAASGRDDQAAVQELLEAALGKRVAIVMARQELAGAGGEEKVASSAAASLLLERALADGSWRD